MVRVRVVLADDHSKFRTRTAALLEPEFEVIAVVPDGRSLIDAAERLNPDILVLDISMPGINGIAAARQLREAGSTAKVVFLTVHQDQEFVRAAMATGAQGYVTKARLASDLAHALREAIAGRSFVSDF